ncbi:MAG: 2OG-Fe(II) oxygenase [Dokdonella sp.]
MSTSTLPLLQDAAFDAPNAVLHREPFSFFIAHDVLTDRDRKRLAEDFPAYPSAGFFPYDAADCGPSVSALVEEITSQAFADRIGAKLGIDRLGQYPTLVTLCRLLNLRHGTIHTDSRSKVATALIYLNETWPDENVGGSLRFLSKIDDIDAMLVPEIKPLYGNFVVFGRADNSFHGHLPHEGERRVIQVAWLTSEEEKLRKTKRGKFSRMFKKLFGALDKRIGAGRDRSASHRD